MLACNKKKKLKRGVNCNCIIDDVNAAQKGIVIFEADVGTIIFPEAPVVH